MKTTLFIAGLMAICSVAASAASVKTSKATPLSSSQMESVKAQGYLYVYYWNGSSYTNYIYGRDLGQTSYQYQYVYSGGPQNGVYYYN